MRSKNFHASSYSSNGWIPQFFNSPYTDQDYDVFEDIWQNTIAGKCIDVLTQFVIGNGFRPVAKLKRHIADKNQEKAQIQSYNPIIDELIAFDQKPKINLVENTRNSFRNMQVYGRSVLAFEQGQGRIPFALKPINPRDLSRVFVRQDDWSLSSVYAFQKTQLIKNDEMIYFVNMANSPIRRTLWYGYSSLQRVVGIARAIREIYEFDIIEIAKALWAGYGLITVDNSGLSENEKKADLEIIKSNLKAGAFNIISGKKDEINYQKFDTDPKVGELMAIVNQAEKAIIGNFGIPAPLLGREEEANMATLFGKIRLFINGIVEPLRRELARTLATQWYERNLAILHPQLLNEISIDVEFEPILIEGWVDQLDGLQKLKNLIPTLPDTELLKLAGLEELTDKLQTNQELINGINQRIQ